MTKKIIIRTTEADSSHQNLELMSTKDLLSRINQEDQSVPLAIEKVLPKIEKTVNAVHKKMKEIGRAHV